MGELSYGSGSLGGAMVASLLRIAYQRETGSPASALRNRSGMNRAEEAAIGSRHRQCPAASLDAVTHSYHHG
jgi:hypothetical protein